MCAGGNLNSIPATTLQYSTLEGETAVEAPLELTSSDYSCMHTAVLEIHRRTIEGHDEGEIREYPTSSTPSTNDSAFSPFTIDPFRLFGYLDQNLLGYHHPWFRPTKSNWTQEDLTCFLASIHQFPPFPHSSPP